MGTVNGLREEQRVGLQARKGSSGPIPGDFKHLQQPNEGKRDFLRMDSNLINKEMPDGKASVSSLRLETP